MKNRNFCYQIINFELLNIKFYAYRLTNLQVKTAKIIILTEKIWPR